MRRNHAHDKDLLDKIERRLAENQPTGFEVIDDLADTVPRADPRFRDELEARLMIRMQSREEEREIKPMQTSVVLAKTERLPRPVFKPSLTLFAAVLVMIIVGAALLMLSNGSQPDTESGAGIPAQDDTATPTPTSTHTPVPSMPSTPLTSHQMTVTAIIAGNTATGAAIEALGTPTPVIATLVPLLETPTPIPSPTMTATPIPATILPPDSGIPAEAVVAIPPATLRMVVIAARDLPQGTRITQADVILTYWPAEAVPDGAYDGLVQLVGHHTMRDIARWQPIFVDDVG